MPLDIEHFLPLTDQEEAVRTVIYRDAPQSFLRWLQESRHPPTTSPATVGVWPRDDLGVSVDP